MKNGAPQEASVYDPMEPMGKMFFNIIAAFAEFLSDLINSLPDRNP